ncbi:hypothetical protein, partial [Aeromonas hydrophila]|uniref:hypothetical protein n=1 Tax=Aeromonas hydrophila TaxID=644 RepID=UPI002B4A2CB1
TRDPDLGKVVLYQLSYSRLYCFAASCLTTRRIIRTPSAGTTLFSHFGPFPVLFAQGLDGLPKKSAPGCDPTGEFEIKSLK